MGGALSIGATVLLGDGVDAGGDLRQHGVDDQIDVGVGILTVFRGDGMSAQEGGDQIDGVVFVKQEDTVQ